jgi:hypothetical protein
MVHWFFSVTRPRLEAVIGCMGDVDAYLLPDAKGYQAMLRHLLGEDDEYRQKVRDQNLGPVMVKPSNRQTNMGHMRIRGI